MASEDQQEAVVHVLRALSLPQLQPHAYRIQFRLTVVAASASASIGRLGSSDGSHIWMPYDVRYTELVLPVGGRVMKALASERECASGSWLKGLLSRPATSGLPRDGQPDTRLGHIGVTRPSPLLIVLNEVDAPGMPGIRSSLLSNKTAESRGLYFFGRKVIGFCGREGVPPITVKANEESDGP